ncbi:MAG TPA: amino acid adenylation domain-containing protein [Thermoanaerobaculia bacterium]|jgi:amino acid adenylation domain-containing protein|nr:amino acid adenylation domain-containing protein [Thermoanaerobaculia bacterium]
MIELASRLENLSPAKRELLLRQLRKLQGTAPRPVIRSRRQGAGDFPLSYAQQRLWFLDQLQPGNPFYNVPGAVRLRGPFDEGCLGRALTEIVRRHESLRTCFPSVDGRPVQRIAPPAVFPLPVVDLSILPEAERRLAARALLQAEGRHAFDLASGPLVHAVLLRMGLGERILGFALHHIVSDAWSMRILIRELTALYQVFLRGAPSPLFDLPVQYADYAVAEREWLDGETLAPQLAYWRGQLAGLPGPLELPADRPRPEVQTFRGAREPVAVSAGVTAALKLVGQQQRATAFMTLLAGLASLLSRYTGRDDLPVGTPIANRDRVETEGLIGFFVNTLVLRCDLSGEPTFRELLERVREVVLEAFAHPDLPFERLVEELAPDRSLAHTPIFQVVFAFQALTGEAGGAAAGPALEALPVESGRSLFDLTLTLEEAPGHLGGLFEYNTDLFDAIRMRRMAAHFETLLTAAAGHPDRRLSELPLLSESERHQLAREWNGEAAETLDGLCLHQRFAAQAAGSPSAVAAVCEGERLTYGELDQRANRLARHLIRLGVPPGGCVGLCLERSLDLVVAILGTLKAGASYVPLDPAAPRERLAFLLADSHPPVLLTQEPLAGSLPPPGPEMRVVLLDRDREEIAREAASDPCVPVTAGHPAYVIYTSGSTGRPKGVVVRHGNAARLFSATERWFGFGPDDVWTLFHSYAFDFSVWEIWGALLHGGRLVIVPYWVSRSPEAFYDLLRRERATVLSQTPSAFRQLVWAEETVLAGSAPELALRYVIFGGEALEPAMLAPWLARHGDRRPRLINMYGITETTVHVTYREVGWRDVGRAVSAVGEPIPDLGVHLLDRFLSPVPLGVPGEVHVGGAGLAAGYLGRPELTAERFVPNPFGEAGSRLYRSGDLARYRPDRDLEYLGRIDHQVKVRGFRIELGEIESALARHPAVRAAAVLAVEDPERPGERRLVGYVVPAAATAPTTPELRGFAGESLPDYMLPAAIVVLDSLPLTTNGKIDRRALAALRPLPAVKAERTAPRTPAEEILAGIWERVLHVDGVGAHDDFFDLGGHSLLATQVVSRLREAFDVELPLRVLFEAPTVAQLAARVEEARAAGRPAAPPIARVPREEGLPLSFGQQRLWFLAQLEPGSVAYNLPTALRLAGGLDPAALAASLGEVVRRHEALRTVFRLPGSSESGEDEPEQVILPALPVPLPLVDLAALPPAPRRAEAGRLAAAEARRPFDLARGPLLRAGLIRLAAAEHVLLLSLHHVVSDGWSMGILVRELTALYGAASQGRPARLPELPVQYADYAAWQRRWLAGEVLEGHLAYWRQALAGVPPLLDLPTDRPRPRVQTFRGDRRTLPFPAELAAAVRELGRAAGLTPFMVLLAALQLLLHRYSGQAVVAVGSPVAGRSRAETEGLIGFFVNTLVLAGDLAGEPGFRALLARVREAALGAYAHQDLPFEKLVEELAPERNLAHAPLFQVLFSFQAAAAAPRVAGGEAAGAAAGDGLALAPLEADMAAAKFDLTLAVEEGAHGFAAALEFNTDLFDAVTAGRILAQLRHLLAVAVADPETPVGELPLLGAAQRAQLLSEWNDTAAGSAARSEACLHQLFAARARETPDAPAVIAAEGTLTWSELDARASQLASHLRALGVGPEVLVGICMERSLDMVVGMLGILKAGGAYLPLDPAYPRERLDFMLADAAALVVLTQERLLAGLAGRLEGEGGPPCPRYLCLDRDWPAIADNAAAAPLPPPDLVPDHLAYTIYTSGSTGRPKGVAITHRSAVALLDWARGVFPEQDRAGVLASTSICFDLSVFELFLPLCHGGTVILAENALHLPRLAAAGRVTLLNTVPSALAELVRSEGLPAAVRTVVLAGEPLPRRLVDEIHAVPGVERVLNCYGPSEDTTYSTFATVDRGPGLPAIGRPVGGGRALLLDVRLQPVPPGVPGELYLGGAGLARGYLHRPELTAERFVPDPFAAAPGARLYRTGDLARFRPDGELLFLGRVDHQVKVRGFRIELGEIEATLRRHPQVAEAALLARGEPGEQRLVAYVVGQPGAAPGVDELRSFLRARLPAHMVPWAFVALPALPLNANGKLDRRALPDPERGAWGAPAAIEEPQSEMERTIAAIWRELLRLERVGIDDNFFDSGGHSLLTVRVHRRLKSELHRELPLVALFEHPTIRTLARYLDAGDAGETEPASRQRGQDRGARRREAAAGRRRPARPGVAATDHEPEEL